MPWGRLVPVRSWLGRGRDGHEFDKMIILSNILPCPQRIVEKNHSL
jgi:hypothetical protein